MFWDPFNPSAILHDKILFEMKALLSYDMIRSVPENFKIVIQMHIQAHATFVYGFPLQRTRKKREKTHRIKSTWACIWRTFSTTLFYVWISPLFSGMHYPLGNHRIYNIYSLKDHNLNDRNPFRNHIIMTKIFFEIIVYNEVGLNLYHRKMPSFARNEINTYELSVNLFQRRMHK